MPYDRRDEPQEGTGPVTEPSLPAPDQAQPVAEAADPGLPGATLDGPSAGPGAWQSPAQIAPQQGGWPQQGAPQPYVGWPQQVPWPQQAPWPQQVPWPQQRAPQPYVGWPQQGGWPQQAPWPQAQRPAWPTYQQPWMGMQPAGYWPVAAPLPQPQPVAWPIGSVPWGYTNPPAVTPILEAPGEFHPPAPYRAFFSVKRRVSPKLYAFGVIIGLPALAALLAYMISAAAGYQIPKGDVPVWVIVEVIGVVAAVGTFAFAAAQGRQRRADGWKDYAGPSPLITMGALLALVLVLQLPLEVALKAANVDLESAPATLSITLVYLVGYIGLVYLLAVRPKALSWRDIAFPKRLAPSTDDWGGSEPLLEGRPVRRLAARSRFSGRLGDFLIPVVMAVPLMIVSNIAGLGLLFVLGLKTTDISPQAAAPLDAVSKLLLLIAVAVVAPVGEEIFFRGLSANAWGRSMSRNSAILRASLFFAFVHVMNTPSSDIGLFWRVALFNFGARVPVAFALTWLYMRRRSIVASGTLHASYNGLITLITYVAVP